MPANLSGVRHIILNGHRYLMLKMTAIPSRLRYSKLPNCWARQSNGVSRSDRVRKQGRDYAWNWFALHAAQRMQTFNFFLVATAFLIAGYASLLEKHRGAAFGVALLGAWLTFWFHRLDTRSRQLVKASGPDDAGASAGGADGANRSWAAATTHTVPARASALKSAASIAACGSGR